jgi:hypothetical protein
VFTEPLPSSDIWGYTYRHTDCWERFMKYAAEMGSGAVIYIPSLIKIGSGIQKSVRERLSQIERKEISLSLL